MGILGVVDNDLYFSISGGYAGGSVLLKMDLVTHVISELESGSMVYTKMFKFGDIQPTYIVEKEFGDGCYGTQQFSILNRETNILTLLFRVEDGCESGNTIIAIRPTGQFIVAYHDGDGNTRIGDNTFFGEYRQIDSYTLNSSTPTSIITKEQMPKGIKQIVLNKEDDELILYSANENYKFDLNTKLLTKIGYWDQKKEGIKDPRKGAFAVEDKDVLDATLPDNYYFKLGN